LTPTEEQKEILSAFKNTRVLKVNACAGSGKTSTLVLLAEDNPVPSLYVCFNKVIQAEAESRFPLHVSCRTQHSIAFAEFGKYLMHKLQNKPGEKYRNKCRTASEVQRYFGIPDMGIGDDAVTGVSIASLVQRTVQRFETSAEDNVQSKHVPYYEIQELAKTRDWLDTKWLAAAVLEHSKLLWEERINTHSDAAITHDTYLKMWQLSRPVLNYDIIYLDEAQDSNPTILDVLQRQTQSKIVYVGDTHQSIYQFRGAVNAMKMIDAPSKGLSKSWRYGSAVASVANAILGPESNIKGNDSIQSQVTDLDMSEPFTYIFRNNASLLVAALEVIGQGVEVRIEIDTKDFCKKLLSAEALYRKDTKNVKHGDLCAFPLWSDLVEAAKEDPELNRMVRIVRDREVNKYVDLLENVHEVQNPFVTFTTAHKSKGKEWSNVMVANDFPYSRTGHPFEGMSDQEKNLLYVACTRAINKLDLPENWNEYIK